MTESPVLARQFAHAERNLESQRLRTIARGPVGLIGVLVVLCLAVGVVAAIDLRNLQTPRGTALAWTSAVVFGDCTAYERLSVPPDGAGDVRSDEEVCADLRRSTQEARDGSSAIGVEVLAVDERAEDARVDVRVTRPEGEEELELQLRPGGDGWVVVRSYEVCLQVGCP